VQRVWGANLENIADVITGLPVSKIDHAVSVVWLKNPGHYAFMLRISYTPACAAQVNGLYFGASCLSLRIGMISIDIISCVIVWMLLR
jgi:hypothetical protein